MDFSFIDDPRWSQEDDVTKQAMIAAAFDRDIASDERWTSLDTPAQNAMRETYFRQANDYSEYQSAPERRGFIGRAGSAAARGTIQAIGVAGEAAQLADLTPGPEDTDKGLLDIAGEKVSEWAERTVKETPFLRQDKGQLAGEPGWLERGVLGGIESMPQTASIWGLAAVGAGAGSVIPGVGTAVGGAIGGLTGLVVMFGAGTYGQEYNDAYSELVRTRPELSKPERQEIAHRVALGSAAFEVGTELPENIAALVTLGGSKVFTAPVKATLRNILKKPMKEILKGTGKQAIFETVGEMIAGGGQAWVREREGLESPGIQTGVTESIIPALTMSLFFGVGAAGLNRVHSNRMMDALNSEDPNIREEAARSMAARISGNTKDPELGKQWYISALTNIAEGTPFHFDQNVVDFAQVKMAEDVETEVEEPIEDPTDAGIVKTVMSQQTVDDAILAFTNELEPEKSAEESAYAFLGDEEVRDTFTRLNMPLPDLAGKDPMDFLYAQGENIRAEMEARARTDFGVPDRSRQAREIHQWAMDTEGEGLPVEPTGESTGEPGSRFPDIVQSKGEGLNWLRGLLTPDPEQIESAAQEASTSAENDLAEPTDAQKEAGNYKKGHITIWGMPIAIENPRGSTRSGKDRSGKEWSIEMQNHYGYFNRTEGKDGDQIDVFIGPDVGSNVAFIVDQVDTESGEFDEHKTLLGFRDIESAREGYLSNYEEGWQGLGNITEVPIETFREWIGDGTRKAEPYARIEDQASETDREVPKVQGEDPTGERQLILSGLDALARKRQETAKGHGLINIVRQMNYVETHTMEAIKDKYPNLYKKYVEEFNARTIRGDQGQDLSEKAPVVERAEPEIEGAGRGPEAVVSEREDTGGEDIQQPEETGTGTRDREKRLDVEKRTRVNKIIQEIVEDEVYDRESVEELQARLIELEGKERRALIDALANVDEELTDEDLERLEKLAGVRLAGAPDVSWLGINQDGTEVHEDEGGRYRLDNGIRAYAPRPLGPGGGMRPPLSARELYRRGSYEYLTREELDELSPEPIEIVEQEPSLKQLRRDLDSEDTTYRGEIGGVRYEIVWDLTGDVYTHNFRRDGELVDDDAWHEDIDDAIDAAVEDARSMLEDRRQTKIEFGNREEAAVEELEGETAPESKEAEPVATEKRPGEKGYGDDNTVFTKDAADKARELLKKKLNQIGMGLDPEIVQAGIQLAGYHIEAGARSFIEFSKAMIADIGDSVRPYLRSWYEAVRYYPGFDTEGMTPADQITEDVETESVAAEEPVSETEEPAAEEPTGETAGIQMDVVAGKHTKKGHDIWTVILGERVDRETFVELRGKAKGLGGYYSRYKGGGAVPGFIFDNAAAANEFAGKESDAEKQTIAGGSKIIAGWVAERLDGAPIQWKELFDKADEEFGGTQAQGVYTPKDAYDALEMGVNQYIANHTQFDPSIVSTAEAAVDAVKELSDLISKIPTQTKRTDEQDKFQQFSTPPPLSYVANWVANLSPDDSYMEPSAGVGGLAIFGKLAQVQTLVNELSDRRADLLDQMGFDKVYRQNAEQLNNILPKDVRPTVIVMNPPFSATGGRVSTNKTMYGARHIEQALARLADGGRLVAIVGRGMAMDRPTFKKWWDRIQTKYNVIANVGINGEEYRKYGTTFDNQILVIDKTGPTTDNIVTGFADKISELPEILEGVRNERSHQDLEQPTDQPPLSEPVEEAEGSDTETPTPSDTATGTGTGTRPGTRRPSTGSPVSVPGETGDSIQPPGPTEPETPSVSTARKPEGDGGESIRESGNSGERGPISGELALSDDPEQLDAGELTDSLYEEYTPHVKISGAQKHPTPLVESAAMAAIDAPPVSYVPNLPQAPIKNGNLSDIQLSAIAQAGEAHQKTLLDGKRKGFFIGDGTGVGKGREIGGIIWDNWRQGRKKAIWISENFDLLKDAKRDLSEKMGIGWEEGEDHIFGLNKTKVGKKVKKKQGIMFASYHTVRGSGQSSYSKVRMDQPPTLRDQDIRINQIVNWFGEDFDGVIAFDESHNMANAAPERGERGTKPPSGMALAGLMLQERLPNARVVYVSATGATEVRNLIYASRLGLWGPGTEFRDESRFVNGISGGGVAAMELVASNLKAMGLYTARSLSYDDVGYDRITHSLTDKQRAKYNELASAWQIVLQNINEAVELTGSGKRGAQMSQFWGAQQRFFNQIISTMQMPSAIKKIKKDIEDGHAVVLQLVNTDEAQQERALARQKPDEELEDLDLTPRDALIGYLENGFPVQEWEEYEDEHGNTVKRPVYDAEGNPVLNAEAVAMRDDLITRVMAIRMPNGPLDYLLEEFGAANISEVTGRSRRVVTDMETGKKVIQRRSSKMVESDVSDFMDDEKQILVFSGAGATGRSFHADKRFKNQRKRMHYLLQPGWRADRAVQGMGRSHRSNQAQAPEFFLVQTDLNGQKRFISSIARRLDQLGALTKGQRQTGSQGIFQAKDNLESSYANEALTHLISDIVWNRAEGITQEEFEAQTGLSLTGEAGIIIPNIRQFLNRLLSMNIDFQNTVFDAFSDYLDLVLDGHQMAGTLDVGIETIRGNEVVKKHDEEVFSDPESGATAVYKIIDVTNPNTNKVDFVAATQSFGGNSSGFYRNLKSGRIWVGSQPRTRTDTTGELKTEYHLMAPSRRMQRISEDKVMDPNYWAPLTQAEAEPLWEDEYKKLPEEITERHHLVTGALLPVWNKIYGSPRIYRLQTDAGEKMIGRVVHPDNLEQTLEDLGAASTAAPPIAVSPESIHTTIMETGASYKLRGGWELKRSRVSGDHRIELKNVDYDDFDFLKDAGVINERINYGVRYFVPTTESGIDVIKTILAEQPVISVQGAGERLSGQFSMKVGDAGLTLTDLHDIFPGQTVGLSPNGAVWIRTGGRNGVRIELVDQIDQDNAALEIAYGWLGESKKMVGKYENGTIYLQRDLADKWTVAHESIHWLEDIGVIKPLEIEALKGYIRGQVKKGNLETLNPDDIGGAEDRAQFIADELKARAQKGAIGRIVTKIADFIDSIVNLFTTTARSVTRGVSSGNILNRPGVKAPSGGPQFAVAQIENSPVISKLFAKAPTKREAISEYIATAKTKEGRGVARDRLIAKTLDSLHFIKQRLGDRPYKMHRALTGIKSASFAMFLEHGKLKWIGDALSSSERNKGVLSFLREIGPDWKNLLYWTVAKRSEYLARPTPEHPHGRENLITEDDRQEIFRMVGDKSLRGQKWSDLSNQLQAFNKNILDIAEQAGLINAENRAMWEHDFYIPFYRIFEDPGSKQEFLSGPRKSIQHITSQIRQLRGGESQLGDPVENLLKNWMHLLDSAARNKARDAAYEAGKETGIIQDVPKKDLINVLGQKKVTRFAVVKKGNKRASALFYTPEEARFYIDKRPTKEQKKYGVEKRIETLVKFGNMKDLGVLSFQKDGKAVYFRTDDTDLYNSLLETNNDLFNNFIMKMMGKAKRTLSYAATFGPAFRIRNMMRDTIHTSIINKDFMPFLDTARGFMKAMREDQDYIEYMASGYGFGSSYIDSADPTAGARFVERIIKKEGKSSQKRILDTGRKVLNVWEKIGSASENAARVALYTNLKKKGYSNLDAGFEARDLMDFSMSGGGTTTQLLIRTIPFLNARVQAFYKLGRAAKQDPRSFAIRSALLTISSLALWSIFKDDERYKELEDWDKWTYYHFWDGNNHYRIPKPFEIGAMFSSLPETIANVMNGTEEGKEVWDWFKFTAHDILRVDMPQLFKPLVEERFNKSMFTGRSIVPEHMTRLKASEQYHPWTSETARMIGTALNMAPLKVQHYIRGYTSSIGMYFLAMADLVSQEVMGYPDDPARTIDDYGLGFVRRQGPARSTKYVTDFYDTVREMDSLNRTINHYRRTGQFRKAEDILKDEKKVKLLRSRKSYNKINQRLRQINNRIKLVYVSPMGADRKRQEIDRLTEARNKLLERIR